MNVLAVERASQNARTTIYEGAMPWKLLKEPV